MKRADLHVHSHCSAHPSEWFLQRLGSRESYTTPETVYKDACNRGMDFVTITDHNQIEGVLELQRRYPERVFTGVESTTYFPEDRCKIHILIYGLTCAQFGEIELVRNDVYQLRDYLKAQQLAHSVAHATFSINNKLTVEHIYRLLLLFDYFEIINGARTKRVNDDFFTILTNLQPEHIEDLRKKFRIEPWSDESWHKGFTGGSDDHSGLHIGATFTTAKDAASPAGFLEQMRLKRTFAGGRHNDYRGFAFSIYKIAYDFSKEKSCGISTTIMASINKLLFEGQGMGLKNRIALTRLKMRPTQKCRSDLGTLVSGIIETIEKLKAGTVDERCSVIYDKVAVLSDELVRSYLLSIEEGLADGDISRLIRAATGMLPVAFFTLPLLSTVNLMNRSRHLQEKLDRRFLAPSGLQRRKKILWFTDTITDLNGPSETIQKLSWLAFYQDLDLLPVVCLLPGEKRSLLPPSVIELPLVWSYTLPFFSSYTARIPSILAAIKKICDEEPDEILISTPGPVGLLGLLAARLLHIPCKGIYHTDFSKQATFITGDESVCAMLETYVQWFYRQCDEVKVPSQHYIDILSERGLSGEKMTIFRRGIESDLFYPRDETQIAVDLRRKVFKNSLRLLYVGRISKEKNVDFILEIYSKIQRFIPDASLVFAGNGPEPYYSDFRKQAEEFPEITFLGRVNRNGLPLVYSSADMLLFPSTTDTFGMVVLEAQACGLPVLVSDCGGPQEIIIDGSTGYVVPADDPDAWTAKILGVATLMQEYPEAFARMRNTAHEHAVRVFNWQNVLADIFGTSLPEQGNASVVKQSEFSQPVY